MTTPLIVLGVYSVLSYLAGGLFFLRGSSKGCGLNSLAVVATAFSPLVVPFIVWEAIAMKLRKKTDE